MLLHQRSGGPLCHTTAKWCWAPTSVELLITVLPAAILALMAVQHIFALLLVWRHALSFLAATDAARLL